MPLHIQQATPALLPSALRILVDSFAADPSISTVLEKSGDTEQALEVVFSRLLKHYFLPRGYVDVAVDDATGEVLGVSLWSKPDSGPISARALMKEMPAVVRAIGGARRDVVTYLRSTPQIGLPHWYLFSIGVSANSRGRGVGGALLDHGLTRVPDSDAVLLEASTPRSAKLYRTKGFVDLGDIPGTGERMMWRPVAP